MTKNRPSTNIESKSSRVLPGSPSGIFDSLNRPHPEYVRLEEIFRQQPMSGGALPPVAERTKEREDELMRVQFLDLKALGIPNKETSDTSNSIKKSARWTPVIDDTIDPKRFDSTFPTTSPYPEELIELALYAEKRDANALIKTEEPNKEEEGSQWSITEKRKATKTHDIHSGAEKQQRERNASVTWTGLEEKWSVYEKENTEGIYQNHIRAFGAQTKVTADVGRFSKNQAASYGAKGEASINASMLDWENKVTSSGALPMEAGVNVSAVKGEAKASGEATINWQEGEATLKGELGADVTIVEAVGKFGTSILPTRLIEGVCSDTSIRSWTWADELCRSLEVREYDYGLVVNAQGGLSTGLSAKGNVEASKTKNSAKFGAGIKAVVGGGASGKISVEIGRFKREQVQ